MNYAIVMQWFMCGNKNELNYRVPGSLCMNFTNIMLNKNARHKKS